MEKIETMNIGDGSREWTNSRVSVKATVGGIIVTLSCMYFLMSLAAVLGFWSFQYEEIPNLGTPFWSVTSAAWIFSVCLGSLIAVLIQRTQSFLSGFIQAFVLWGGAYLIFGGLTSTIAESSMMDIMLPPSETLLKIGFLGDVLSLLGAVASSGFAVQIQKGVERKQARHVEAVEPGFQIPVHN